MLFPRTHSSQPADHEKQRPNAVKATAELSDVRASPQPRDGLHTYGSKTH